MKEAGNIMSKHIPLATPTMHKEELQFIQEAFDKNWVAPLGFNCDGFEREILECLGQDRYALAVSSGTAALHLAVKLAGVKPGDIVLCSDMTFAATVNPVSYEGGVQVFVDSEKDTWNMDPEALEAAFQKYPQAKVVVLVHLYGIPARMDEILEVCRRHNAILIEDAAEALGASYKGQMCGTFGDYGILSFNGNKIITTSGGGMLLTKKEEDRSKALYWSTQARENTPWYEHKDIGYNYRMSNIVAGIGRGQLLHLQEHCDKKKAIYQMYEEGLKDLPMTMNPWLEESVPNFWLSCATLEKGCGVKAMELFHWLRKVDIETRPIWKPMHMQPVFADHDFISVAEKPANEQIFKRGLCLPSDIKMTENQQKGVIDVIRSVFCSKR